jgi:hypothetical protein
MFWNERATYIRRGSFAPVLYPTERVATTSASFQGLAQFERTLERQTEIVNKQFYPKRKWMNVTGATKLSQSFRDMIADVRSQLSMAHEEMTQAMTELQASTETAKAVVKAVKAETADLTAALGQITNGPPSS